MNYVVNELYLNKAVIQFGDLKGRILFVLLFHSFDYLQSSTCMICLHENILLSIPSLVMNLTNGTCRPSNDYLSTRLCVQC